MPLKRSRLLALLVLINLAGVAGCVVGPDYHRPAVETPPAYGESKGWKVATPGDRIPRDQWWEMYGDPQLNSLVAQVAISNQNVAAAAAQYRQALAVLGAARTGYYPTVSTALSVTGQQSPPNSASSSGASRNSGPTETDRLEVTASWEPDLWGRIRRTVKSNEAAVQASAADLQSALLSAQATLVQTYLQLRINDAQRRLLEQTVAAYADSLRITDNRYKAGVVGRLDVTRSQTQLQSTRAQAIDLGVQRAQLAHAIAILIGKPPAEVAIAPREDYPALPAIPVGVPSTLLERRPDIAAAERRMAAANAQIGVAQAAFFPTLTLSATSGFESAGLVDLLTLPSGFWSLGPSLAETVLDFGKREQQKQQARAAYEQSVADYRQTVLSGFQEVEDNLAALRVLDSEATVQASAATAAAQSLKLADNQYKAGTISYLDVITAETASLSAERTRLDIVGRRLVASAALIKALGGGWQVADSGDNAPAPASR